MYSGIPACCEIAPIMGYGNKYIIDSYRRKVKEAHGDSEVGVTMNTYTHLDLDDAKNEMIRMEELEQARKEIDKAEGKKPMKQNVFKVV